MAHKKRNYFEILKKWQMRENERIMWNKNIWQNMSKWGQTRLFYFLWNFIQWLFSFRFWPKSVLRGQLIVLIVFNEFHYQPLWRHQIPLSLSWEKRAEWKLENCWPTALAFILYPKTCFSGKLWNLHGIGCKCTKLDVLISDKILILRCRKGIALLIDLDC